MQCSLWRKARQILKEELEFGFGHVLVLLVLDSQRKVELGNIYCIYVISMSHIYILPPTS